MVSGGEKWHRSLSRWLDQWKIAGSGLLLVTRSMQFWVAFIISFTIFGTLMNLLSGSTASIDLFWVSPLDVKMRIIFDAFLAIFGVGRNFWDFFLTFCIVILQSTLIGLVVFVWRRRRRDQKAQALATATNVENVQNAGLATGLAVLGSGCPTCGTTLLAPMLGTLFSTGGFALARFVSGILTITAVIITLLAIQRVGGDAYAMIISERYQKTHKEKKT